MIGAARAADGRALLTRPTAVVLTVSGLTGLCLGVAGAVWQDALEPAQVLAGLVTYPADNPVYLYSTKTWTLLHQLPALALWLGLSERTVAILLSGAIGAASFQALGMVVLALSRDTLLSSVTPVFLYLVGVRGDGVGYPVWYLGVPYTYGLMGLALAVLVVALLAANERRVGGLLLGVLPAIHPAFGAWTWALVVVAMATEWKHWTRDLHAVAWPFAVGVALALSSAAVHLIWFAPAVYEAPPATTSGDFLRAMFTYWDEHRRPINWSADVVAMSYASALLAVAWWWRMRRRAGGDGGFALKVLAASLVVGGLLSTLLTSAPELGPDVLRAAMPSRLLNLSVFAGLAAIVGVAARPRSSLICQGLLLALVSAMTLTHYAPDNPLHVDPFVAMRVMAVALAIWAVTSRNPIDADHRPRGAPGPDETGSRAAPSLAEMCRWATICLCLALSSVETIAATRGLRSSVAANLVDRTTHPVLAAAADRGGLLLTASSLHRIQLVTRRPVLLDGGAIDALAYVPAMGPAFERIATEVYGISLLRPPTAPGQGAGYLPPDTGKALWAARTVDEWRAIGATFGVTDVLTFGDWQLQLPRVAAAPDLALWAIPR